MPIIEETVAGSAISQGDILHKVPLHRTKIGIEPVSDRSKAAFCMIISRPCNAANKNDLLVAEIVKYKASVPDDIKTFDTALKFLQQQRDGRASPDRFYLGEIPGQTGRFVAALDAVFTISFESQAQLQNYRIASLNRDFSRDLHLRMFNAIASLGFDDTDWLPTSDLKFLIEIGKKEFADLQSLIANESASYARKFYGSETAQKPQSPNPEKLEMLEQKMKPYKDRLAIRESASA